MNVFLDDHRPCPKGFVLAKTLEECIALLEEYEVDVLSLDYDLGWGEPNGLDVARCMVERGLYAKEIYLHSSSMSGRYQMYQLLSRHVPEGTLLWCHPVPEQRLKAIRQACERGETE